MNKFILSPEHQQGAEAILTDCGVSASELDRNILYKGFDEIFHEDDLWEYSAVLEKLLDCPTSYPLFANEDEREQVVANQQNYIVLKTFLKEVQSEIEDIEEIMLSSAGYDDERLIKQGEYVIRVIGEQFITLDFAKYGFDDAFQMAYVLGAHITNLLKWNEKREVEKHFGREVYVYENHGHGDFRLAKYELTEFTSQDPFEIGAILPFGKAKHKGSILGYHSVETYVLAMLLGHMHLTGKSCDAIDNFEDIIKSIKEEGQVLSNCADSGMYDSSQVTFGFAGLSYKKLPELHPEPGNDFYYQSVSEGDLLNVYRKKDYDDEGLLRMSIETNQINDLIIGLFEKVARGNGRSSVVALEDTMNYYRIRFCGVDRDSVKFNTRVCGVSFDKDDY